MTGGFRFTWDRRFIERHGVSNIAVSTACSPPIPLTPRGCALPFSAKFDYPAWTIGVDYKISDNLFVYAKSSNASMAGGFNTRPTPAGQESFQPEGTTDFEIGAKIDAFDRRFRANVAAFALETKDAQRTIAGVIGGRLTQFVQNAGDVKASGIELEMTALPWQGMELKLGASYLDSKYEKGTFVEDRGLPGAPLLVDRSAEPIPQAPEWTFSLGATQDFDLDIGTLKIHADYTYLDDKVISVSTATPCSSAAVVAARQTANDLARLKDYSLINGRIALTLESGVELSVFGRNLTDEKYYTYTFDGFNTLGFTTQYQGTPRTYGVALRYNF